MGAMEFIYKCSKTPMLYTALLALAHAIIGTVAPAFPQTIIAGADGVIVVIAGVWTGADVLLKDSREKLAKAEAERDQLKAQLAQR